MPDRNKLILRGADYKAFLIIPNIGSWQMLTAEEITWEDAGEGEFFHAVGEEEAIGHKVSNYSHTGTFSMQNGEAMAIAALAGLVSLAYVRNAVIAISAVVGGFSLTYSGLNVITYKSGAKRKDKETIASMTWGAISVV